VGSRAKAGGLGGKWREASLPHTDPAGLARQARKKRDTCKIAGSETRRIVILIATLAMLLLLAAPAAAALPAEVEIVAEVTGGGLEWSGPFAASGPAVTAGLMCPSGWTESIEGRSSGGAGQIAAVQVTYRFMCDDGSGEFDLFL
jgi:hypothetical protein